MRIDRWSMERLESTRLLRLQSMANTASFKKGAMIAYSRRLPDQAAVAFMRSPCAVTRAFKSEIGEMMSSGRTW